MLTNNIGENSIISSVTAGRSHFDDARNKGTHKQMQKRLKFMQFWISKLMLGKKVATWY
jgi:hypothetical protein